MNIQCFHHSRNSNYRFPQGAAPCAARVRLTLDADGGDWYLWLQTPQREAHIPLIRLAGQYSAAVQMPGTPGLVHYCFYRKDGEETLFYGAESGEGRVSRAAPQFWQITVYRMDFTTPEWFRHALCYQVFPDRFARGDFDAFARRAKARIAAGRHLRLHEDWSEEPYYLPESGKPHYIPDDYFGGDLTGLREKLPYLQSLGVTCLYLNPIFEAYSNHRYNTADYMEIDSLLGNSGDFDALCADAKAMGIRIILDGVFSHTGDDSRYFDRYGLYGGGACESKSSPYYPWYSFHDYPYRYESWWGFPTLPNVNEMTPSYVEFVNGRDGVLAHWQARGASGWRLDVADELPDDFIRILRNAVKRSDPDALLLGEVWDDCSTKLGPGGRRAYVDGDLLDSTMNYPFLRAVLPFCAGASDAFALNEALQRLRENYPEPFYLACMNLLSSHDEARALARLSGGIGREKSPRAEQALFAPGEQKLQSGKRRFLLATAIQLCHPGVPCVYYGDEAGLWGLDDPFNRKTYPWDAEDKELLSEMQELMQLRAGSAVLQSGHTRMGALNAGVFAILRYADNGEVVILLANADDESNTALLYPALLWEGADGMSPVPFAGVYEELGTGETLCIDATLNCVLPPLSYKILRKDA
ncbi:MAG: glycoside hydrolase family 13 protein [Clostridiales bacterium]|nr:glycoside hydrolase family 13 protein [Clostridiales bacterium]